MTGIEPTPLGLVAVYGDAVVAAHRQAFEEDPPIYFVSQNNGITFSAARCVYQIPGETIIDIETLSENQIYLAIQYLEIREETPNYGDNTVICKINLDEFYPVYSPDINAYINDVDQHPNAQSSDYCIAGGEVYINPQTSVRTDARFMISNDGGANFTTFTPELPDAVTNVWTVAADPHTPASHEPVYYLAGNQGVFQLNVGVSNWHEINNGLPTGLTFSDILVNNTGQYVYLASNNGIYKRSNGGNWQLTSTGINPNYLDIHDIEIGLRDNYIFCVGANAAGDTKIFGTGNSGARWVDMTGILPADHPVKNIRHSVNSLYVGNEDGIYRIVINFADDITEPTTWAGEVWLMDDITVSSTLTLDNSGDSLRIYAMGDYTITVDGGDIVTANADDAHKALFKAGDGVDGWGGLEIKQFSDTLNHTLEYLQVENAEYGIKIIPNANVPVRAALSHCRFQNDSTGVGARDTKALTIQYCTLADNVLDGIYLFNLSSSGSHCVSNCEICDNGHSGIYVNRCGSALSLVRNYIHGNDGGDAGFVYQGITNYNSSPSIHGNLIAESGTAAIGTFNSAAPSLVEGVNTLETSDSVAAAIYADGGFPVLNNAYNNVINSNANNHLRIKDNTNPRVYRRVEYNWWGSSSPDSAWFSPDGYFDYNPCCTAEQTLPGFQYGTASLDSNAYELLSQAIEAEGSDNYSAAYALLLNLVNNYTEVEDAVCQGLPHILICGPEAGQSYEVLYAYFNGLYQAAPTSLTGKTARHLRNDCSVAEGEYREAIDDYQAIINCPPTLADSVFAVLDQAQVYLIMEGQGMPGTFSLIARPTLENYRQKESNLMTLLHSHDSYSTTVNTPLAPTCYSLEQNYPNPFNPATTISFALPYTGQVRLMIFDLQGRVVAKLVDRTLEAGIHQVAWDASNLASGLYLSRLQTGDYSAVKKMMLVK